MTVPTPLPIPRHTWGNVHGPQDSSVLKTFTHQPEARGADQESVRRASAKEHPRRRVGYGLDILCCLFANQFHALVVGTDHAAEAVVGFFTKYGDGGVDLTPLSGLTKNQGRFLLRFLGADERIYTKPPTADLLDTNPGQLDEVELNISYQVIDDYLEGKDVPNDVAQQIEQRYSATEHKRHVPVTPFDTWWKAEGGDESFHQ